MRTTLEIDDDVLLAAKALARRQKRTAGAVISELARKGLVEAGFGSSSSMEEEREFFGIQPLRECGRPVTDELVNALREKTGD